MLNENTKDLILIGNGFDLWQKLPTSFSCFEKYYYAHKEEIEKKLNIATVEIGFENDIKKLNYIEMFYAFYPTYGACISEQKNIKPLIFLCKDFWNDFENNLLSYLDLESIIWGYGSNEEDFYLVPLAMKDLVKLLVEFFTSWINSITVEEKPSEYNFDNSLFINFNYTNTLEKRFNVKPEQDFHIHGVASDKKSIVFGHGVKPQSMPIEYFSSQFFDTALEFEELVSILYKNPHMRITALNRFLKKKNIKLEQFEDIYALGLSFGKSDFEYYKFLSKQCPQAKWHISYHTNKDKQQILKVLNKLNITNYELFNTIEETIKKFKTAT